MTVPALSLAERPCIRWRCQCGYVDEPTAFKFGRGRMFGTHPEVKYCPACHRAMPDYPRTVEV